jgi:hypothetical protein
MGGTESEKDLLTGVGTGHGAYIVEEYDPTQPGIYNAGTIYMGGGADVIDAISGGFAGKTGVYDLGSDASADTVAGFGEGTFKGGGGLDQLILPEGKYAVEYISAPAVASVNPSVNVKITMTNTSYPSVFMSLEGFEQVAGVADLAPKPFISGLNRMTAFEVNADGNLVVPPVI